VKSTPHNRFDPACHMAIGQMETDEVASGHVAQVVNKGYVLNGSVIRPAHVIVAK
jgi:molecular chaperone GrpE